MSKSLNNVVGLSEDPLSMYSKLEKVPDSQVENFITLLTDCDLCSLPQDPRELQKFMALNVTAQFHGMKVAQIAQEDASKIIAGVKENVEDVPKESIANIVFPVKAFYLLRAIGLCSSSSEARRMIQGGGVRLDGEKIVDPNLEFFDSKDLVGKILQIGKKIFRRISD